MSLPRGSGSSPQLETTNLRRSASSLQPPASSTEASDPGAYALWAMQAPPSAVEPGAAANFGVQPDAIVDNDSADEIVVLDQAMRKTV
jgi:hypothetical protein